ncbi:hypothetical protein B0H19DRAFT_1067068 [Mycena capillaripes]|nr:hypothetical protein B0H19DRAFT_1067068 [Mycena capillaripes]
MSVWAPPPGLLSLPVEELEPGERPELLRDPSDPTKHWYYRGCTACVEVCGNRRVVASLCSKEELRTEAFKNMGNSTRFSKHSSECDAQYYKAYSKKLEAKLHRVREERRLACEKLGTTRRNFFNLEQQVSSLGRDLVNAARMGGETLAEIQQQLLSWGDALLSLKRIAHVVDFDDDA